MNAPARIWQRKLWKSLAYSTSSAARAYTPSGLSNSDEELDRDTTKAVFETRLKEPHRASESGSRPAFRPRSIDSKVASASHKNEAADGVLQYRSNNRPAGRRVLFGEEFRYGTLPKGFANLDASAPRKLADISARPSFRRQAGSAKTDVEVLVIPSKSLSRTDASPLPVERGRLVPEVGIQTFTQPRVKVGQSMPVKLDRLAGAAIPRETKAHRIDKLFDPSPATSAELVRALKNATALQPDITDLEHIIEIFQRYDEIATTSCYNVLLEAAHRSSHRALFKRILGSMNEHNVTYDSQTWNVIAVHRTHVGQWRSLLDSIDERNQAGIPLDIIGWTRIVGATTQNGAIHLEEQKLSGHDYKPSPSLLAHVRQRLSRNARPLSPREVFLQPRTDVDAFLAALLPEGVETLDYQCTLVVAQRLARQCRLEEAQELVDNYLDDIPSPPDTQEATAPTDENVRISKFDMSFRARDRARNNAFDTPCMAFLHVLIEGHVIKRIRMKEIKGFLKNYLRKHERHSPQPTYLTLYQLLNAYRNQPPHLAYPHARDFFEEFQRTYNLQASTTMDRFALAKCHKSIQQYARVLTRPGSTSTASVKAAIQDEVRLKYNLDMSQVIGHSQRSKRGFIGSTMVKRSRRYENG